MRVCFISKESHKFCMSCMDYPSYCNDVFQTKGKQTILVFSSSKPRQSKGLPVKATMTLFLIFIATETNNHQDRLNRIARTLASYNLDGNGTSVVFCNIGRNNPIQSCMNQYLLDTLKIKMKKK